MPNAASCSWVRSKPTRDRCVQCVTEHRWVGDGVVRGGGPHPAQGGAGDDVFADLDAEPEVDVVFGSQRQQRLRLHGLQVPGLGRGQWDRPWWWGGRGFLDDAHPAVDHGEGVVFDTFADRVDLDGVGQVVGEVHHHGQAGEHQHEGSTDREPGEVLGAGADGQPHGVQARRGVDEGRGEGAEHDLVGSIAQEVPQQPGRELGR